MLKRKLGLLVAAAVMVGMFSSCINIFEKEKDEPTGGNGIDYTNYGAGEYSIKVKNDSSKNVVCFMNTPREENLISGVKAGTLTGLKKNSLFANSHDFVLFVVTEDDYLANKSNLKALDRSPFATLYAYYNAESAEAMSNMVYTISAFMGGQYYIILNNGSKYNVELRENGLYGESLAFAGANTTQTKINMVEGNYEIFPVFRKFSKKTGEILTSFPKYTIDGEEYPVYFTFSLDNETTSQEFNTMKWFNGELFNASETPSAAYVTIYNGNETTGVSLYKGANQEAAITSTGGKTINGGKSLTFEIPMTSLGKGKYSTSANISGWRVGTSMKDTQVENRIVEAGKMYYIDVSGKTAYDVAAAWRLKDGEIVADPVNYDDEE